MAVGLAVAIGSMVLSCSGKVSKNLVCYLDLCPLTLELNRVLAVVKVHVCAKLLISQVQWFMSKHVNREKIPKKQRFPRC